MNKVVWIGGLICVLLSGCAPKPTGIGFSKYSVDALQVKQIQTPLGGQNYEFCSGCVVYTDFQGTEK